jgi:glycosyltransferase involved in cell wall biosynthesis
MARNLTDKLISGFNSIKYFLTEPVLLKLARSKYEKEYSDQNEQPLISICTPTYNRAKLLLERAVPSVLNQTYKNFEWIIIGDHCTDETEATIGKLADKDKRIKFYNIPKRGYRYPATAENHWFAGPVVANNQALKMVKGKWIARVDDDDFWTEDHLESLLKFAQQGEHEFVSSKYEREKYSKREIVDGERAGGPYYNPKVKEGSGPKIGGVQTWFYRSYLKFFKYNPDCWRKSHNKVNDIDIGYRMYKTGVRMDFLDKSTASIVPRPGEETIGLEAYKASESEKLEHFKF